MTVGETVLVPVNNGQYEEAEVIEIHGDIVLVAGEKSCGSSESAAGLRLE